MNDFLGMKAVCETILPDGRLVKCSAFAHRLDHQAMSSLKVKASQRQSLHQAIECARIAEACYDESFRVTLENGDILSREHAALLELPSILADQRARGLHIGPAAGGQGQGESGRTIALGLCADWSIGVIAPPRADWYRQCLEGLAAGADLGNAEILLPPAPDPECAALHQRIAAAHPLAVVRELDSLAALGGQPTARPGLRRASVWFPVLVGDDPADDGLLELEVILRPLGKTSARQNGQDGEDDSIKISGLFDLDQSVKTKTAQLLSGLRRQDRHGSGEWRTVVRFPGKVDGASYELALAIADRLARGRDFAGNGRIIATGAMQVGPDGEASGAVQDVDGVERKCAAMLGKIKIGTRVLMPLGWRERVPGDFVLRVAERGGSCAFVGRI